MTLPPLHSVVRYCEPGDHRRIAKSLDIIKLLVDAKVQIDGRDCNGCTALYLALDMGVLPFVEALIAAGASVENLDGEGNDIAAVIADGGEKGIGARYGDIYHYVEENYPDRLLEAWVVDGTRQEVG
jgi:ankyrin repeat protein